MEIKLLKHLALISAKELRIKRDEITSEALSPSNLKAWQILATNILEFIDSDELRDYPSVPVNKATGQIWSLKYDTNNESLEGARYFPPKVVLIEKIDSTNGFNVAQLYFDSVLIGPFDVSLEADGMFAEAWHTYSVHEQYLDKCWGLVSEEAVNHILLVVDYLERLGQDEEDMELEKINQKIVKLGIPGDGNIDPIVEEFRDIEIQVGEFFCKPSFALLMKEFEEIDNAIESKPPAILSISVSSEMFETFRTYYAADNYHLQMSANTRGVRPQIDQENEGTLEELTDEIISQMDRHVLIPVRLFAPPASGETIINFVANKKIKNSEKVPSVVVECNGGKIVSGNWLGFPNADTGLYNLVIPVQIEKYSRVEIREEQLNGSLLTLKIIFSN